MAASRNPIQVTVRIAFFQDKPQNLPASNYMVLLSAAAALLSTAFLEVSVPISNNIELAFLQLVVYGVAVAALLYFSRRIARWRQTISALFWYQLRRSMPCLFPNGDGNKFCESIGKFLLVGCSRNSLWNLGAVYYCFHFSRSYGDIERQSFFSRAGRQSSRISNRAAVVW